MSIGNLKKKWKIIKRQNRGEYCIRKKENILSIKIKELPELERPYEKLELYGEQNLSNAELLAIIIKSRNKRRNISTTSTKNT